MGNCKNKQQLKVVQIPNSKKKIAVFNRNDSENFSMSDSISQQFDFFKKYVILDEIGQGAFSKVKLCKNKITNLKYAAKFIEIESFEDGKFQDIINEIKILISLKHPNIIRIFEFFIEKSILIIIMEYLEGGDIFDYIIQQEKLSEYQAAQYMETLLGAINYCHKKQLMHRDLKPQNIMLDLQDMKIAQIKIIDFGISKYFDEGKIERLSVGTPYYVAPEVLKNEYNQKCDLWSLGIICYVFLCGKSPFQGKKVDDILAQVKQGKISFKEPSWKDISKNAKDFIKQLCTFDPLKRPSAQEMITHRWIRVNRYKNDINTKNANLAQTIHNIKSFRVDLKIQQALWASLNAFFQTQEQNNTLIQAFQSIDKNKDGYLDFDELINCHELIIQLNTKDPENEIKKLIEKMDKDENGKIDYQEFVLVAQDRKQMITQQKLEQAFNLFDVDKSGTISLNEFKQIFESSKSLSDEVWQSIFKEADTNQDGVLTLSEFKKILFPLRANNKK